MFGSKNHLWGTFGDSGYNATSFLCCLPLITGARIILILNLAETICTAVMAAGNVILTYEPEFGFGSSAVMQIFNSMWSLAGVPIILVALYGACSLMDPMSYTYVRFYVYYLGISIIIDAMWLIDIFVVRDACKHLSPEAEAMRGKAFACGVARCLSGAVVIICLVLVVYGFWIMLSFLEVLKGYSEHQMSNLLAGIRTVRRDQQYKGYMGPSSIHTKGPHGGSVYDSVRYAHDNGNIHYPA